jgi:HAD superfamily 5'-nucleotidase-like hydrolase
MNLYVNRTLNLKKIKYIGLDMDHTLIKYHSEQFEELAYEQMKIKLVQKHKYPEEVLNLKFEFKRAIRGLVIDKNRGNLLKVSRYGAVREGYHGLQKIDYKKMKTQFGTLFIDLNNSDFDTIDTTFSISHACLFSQLVELKETKYKEEIPEFSQLAEDLHDVLDQSHRDGSIKNVVVQNLDKYIFKRKELMKNILKFMKHDKEFFLVTNSDFEYTNTLLTYAIDEFLPEGQKWTDIFKWVITLSNKPRFFYDQLPILKVDPKTGLLQNHSGELKPGIYQGGSSNHLTNHWDVTGDEILYVGDHIYGDILRLKKDCEWRTALIVEELKYEVEQNKIGLPVSKKIQTLMKKKIEIEQELNDFIADAIEKNIKIDENKKQEFKSQIEKIDKEILPLLNEQRNLHNPYWGEIMRVGIEESQFANQVERFADVYMTDLNDLMLQSPRTYLRSIRRQLPHDIIETIEVD